MINFKNAIAITGGIATGKSSVCNLLKLYGYDVIDADKIAHSALETLSREVILAFGDEILDSNNHIDRKKLGEIVFLNNNKKAILEQILHPFIKEKILQKMQDLESYNKVYFVDIPLFFEIKEKYPIDKVLLIYAPKEMQIQRILKRDNINLDLALKKIESQIDIESKKSHATYIIENTKDLSHLQLQVEEFLKTL